MVYAVLVNYRQPSMTEAAVRSIRLNAGTDDLKIIVVDNASGDGSVERLRTSCADCIILESRFNAGFSAGNNIGIRRALSDGADSVLLINNDVEVEPSFLAPLMEAIRDGKTIATPKIVYADAPDDIWYGGGYVDRRRGGFYHETDAGNVDNARTVTFASGCCILVPAAFFKACGLLDESFFLYYEDAELCMRAKAAGFRIRYEPRSVVRHKVGASTGGKTSKLAVYYGTRNRLEVMRRYGFPLRSFIFVVASRLLLAVVKPHGWSRIRGICDFFRGKMSNVITVNGVFATRRTTGLERFAIELLRALDAMVSPGRIRLLVPRRVKVGALPAFRNVEVVRRGWLSGALWEQWTLPRFARRTSSETLSLANTVPLARPGLACLHDIFYITHADQFRATLKGRLSRFWHIAHYRAIARAGTRVFTVSEYSRRQISETLGIDKERIEVLGNGWEHVKRIEVDDVVFARHPEIKLGNYFLVLGNRSPYKNLAWAISAARNNQRTQWVVAGGALSSASYDCKAPDNVVFTGYVSDGEMKSLVMNCKALVHPSLDEGFGIPPLEALALGRPAVVARASCLPEIYGNAVSYIERPMEIDVADIESCLGPAPEDAGPVLSRYTWKAAAARLLNSLDAMRK